MKPRIIPYFLIILSTLGCAEHVVEIPFPKEELKNISSVAILCPRERPELFMDVTADERFLTFLFAPAIVPQIFLTASFYDMRREDSRMFNELTFDLHIGHALRDSFYRKLQRQAHFYIVPLETVEDNRVVHKLQDKTDKTHADYERIARELGADHVIELSVLAYGVKDPGVFSRPHTVLVAKAVMTRVRDNTVLWQTRVVQALPQDKSFGFDYERYSEDEAKYLKAELDKVAGILAERLVEALGFKPQLPTARLLQGVVNP